MRRSRNPANSDMASGQKYLDSGTTPPASRRLKKIWLIAELVTASMVLAAGAASAALWGTGVSAARHETTLAAVEKAAALSAEKKGIAGLWYETEGYGTIEFFRDGSLRISASAYYWETGTYEYDASSGTGEYTLDDSNKAVSIHMENGLLNIGGALYTTEAVEPQEMNWDDLIEYID